MACHILNALTDILQELPDVGRGGRMEIVQYAERLGWSIGTAACFDQLGTDNWLKLRDWCLSVPVEVRRQEEDAIARGVEFLGPTTWDIKYDLIHLIWKFFPPLVKEWMELGEPCCYEDWMEVKYQNREEKNDDSD